MSLLFQIMLGSSFLALCSALHIGMILVAIHFIKRASAWHENQHGIFHFGLLMGIAFGAIVFAHTIQIWLWAGAFVFLEALPNINDALYFSLVTYTTLGYGDVTVTHEFRTFAAMSAVTGLLNFGLSTAFLVGVITNLLKKREL